MTTPVSGSDPGKTDIQAPRTDFIREAIQEDLASGRVDYVRTRFPPEPNGYLHMGHAKAICIVFGIGQDFEGTTNLRLDDTNPTKEEQEYIDAIQEDVRWLGFDWQNLCYASDYFDQLYEWAVALINKGLAYVDEQTPDEIRENRGNVQTPGTPSPYRDRPAEESVDLLARMKAGEFPDGGKVLRAKIDMASPNMNLRDPVMYRILHATHPRTGDAWCIYPMYDYAHGQSDSIEGITHSLCSLEFEDHRPLYEWFINNLEIFPSRQIEFSRLNITHVITSKRKLKALVDENFVTGWDDPRMPTLRGMRRRGYTPQAIRSFIEEVGITKFSGTTDFSLVEHHLRQDLNQRAERRLAVVDPVELVITNWDADQFEGGTDWVDAANNPQDESAGTRKVPFSGRLFIDRDDFMVDAPKKFFRLAPGREVRLKYGYYVTCTGHETDDAGNVTKILCTYDPETRGGDSPDGRKIKGTIHWVSAEHAIDVEVREYDHLFTTEDPNEGAAEDRDWRQNINLQSLKTVTVKAEPGLADEAVGKTLQFERKAYCAKDPDSTGEQVIFNRTVTLKDSWAKKK